MSAGQSKNSEKRIAKTVAEELVQKIQNRLTACGHNQEQVDSTVKMVKNIIENTD